MTTDATAKSEKHKCTKCDKDFLVIAPEAAFYKKKNLPTPKQCPQCRQSRRLSLRNERQLFRRDCDKCNKKIISTYRPDSKYTIYCQECYWDYLG